MKKTTGRILQREHGQTLLMFVLFMVVLFAFVGLGVDLGFAYITKARLSKAVDSACLTGIRNLFQGQAKAITIANSTFFANYGTSGRDVAPPVPTIAFSTDANNNLLLDVSATVSINTFFIRVLAALPGAPAGLWHTLTVGSTAEATRSKLIMSLVLDRSGSMVGDGGAANMPSAVTNFVNQFDDANDHVAMVSFSYAASTDVPMSQPFKAAITTAAKNLNFNGWTASEPGLTNGLRQNKSISLPAGESVVKVIVFFTDGLANTLFYNFDCGPRNIAPDRSLYLTNSGASASSGCTVPATVPAISGGGNVSTTANGGCDLEHEAQSRAIVISDLARLDGDIVYCIGLGDPNASGECGDPPINPAFLLRVANDPTGASYDKTLPAGQAVLTYDPTKLGELFQEIASKILLRLSR